MDPHTLLGVAPNAGLNEIRQAYKKMALKWHPDRQTNNVKDLADTFTKINHAYQILIRDYHLPDASAGSRNCPMHSPPPSIHSVESFNSLKSLYNLFAPEPSAISSQTTPSSSLGGNPVLLSAPSNKPFHPIKNLKGMIVNDIVTHRACVGYPTNTPIDHAWPPHAQHAKPSIFKQPTGSVPTLQRNGNPIPSSKQSKPIRSIPMCRSDDIFPLELMRPGPPLQPIGMGTSGEWSYSLYLALEEFYYGKRCRFGIVRRYLSGALDNVMVEVEIPPGCQTGNAMVSGGIGHELPDGTLDDVSFILKEVPHERFTRVHDDLLLEVQIPWTDALRCQPKKVYVRGIDGEDIFVYVDYSRDKNLIGSLSVRGAGMPVRERGKLVGRGNLIVNWEIMPAPTRMRTFIRRFFRREV